MIQGIYNSAAAADGLQKWNDVIARNIAASSTPGFKRDVVSFDGVAMGALEFGTNGKRLDQASSMVPHPSSSVSFLGGAVRRSGDPHEFAIEGAGFFKLQRPDGGNVFTRDGQFHVSSTGQLMSKDGFAVVGDSGPIQTLSDGGPLSVTPEGRVRQGTQEVGVLSVYTFARPDGLRRAAGGFVVDSARPQEGVAVENAHVLQGFLEQSNVSPIREMVDMISVSNSLQANQKVLQTFDGMMDRAVQVLGATQ